MNELPNATPSGDPPDAAMLTSALSALMSNPELTDRLRGLLTSAAPPAEATASQAEALPDAPASAPTSADGISTLLSDPELMAKLPQMISVLRPMLSKLSPPAPSKGGVEKNQEQCRNDLLLALKPFLGSQKREAVDTMLRIAKLGSVLRQLR